MNCTHFPDDKTTGEYDSTGPNLEGVLVGAVIKGDVCIKCGEREMLFLVAADHRYVKG